MVDPNHDLRASLREKNDVSSPEALDDSTSSNSFHNITHRTPSSSDRSPPSQPSMAAAVAVLPPKAFDLPSVTTSLQDKAPSLSSVVPKDIRCSKHKPDQDLKDVVKEDIPLQIAHEDTDSHNHHDVLEDPADTSIFSNHSLAAEPSIAPFLTKHIPNQYAPLSHQAGPIDTVKDNSTKYCYRHHPDLKCRRQANEPSMEQLQTELSRLPQSDQEVISRVWSLFSAAPSKHREMMLQGILAQCCFPQLSFISASVRDLIKIDFLTALPAELGLKILSFLDPTSLCKAAQVSSRWRMLADDDEVWMTMCEQHIDRKCTKCGWGLPLLDQKRLRHEKRLMQLRSIHRRACASPTTSQQDQPRLVPVEEEDGHSQERSTVGLPAVEGTPDSRSSAKRLASEALDPAEDSDEGRALTKRACTPSDGVLERSTNRDAPMFSAWKTIYRARFRIGNNWRNRRYQQKTFRGHTNGVLCLQFDDKVIISGSYDTTIKIWDIESGAELRTLRGHTMGVRCLQFDESKIASGSLDGTIKLWSRDTGEVLCTIPGHQGAVVGLHLQDSIIASGSADKSVRVFDFKRRSAIVLRGHSDWVNSVRIDTESRTLLSASDDCTIKLWDLNNKKCIKTLEGHVGQVQALVVLPHEFEPLESDVIPSPRYGSLFEYEASHDSTGSESRALPPRYILSGGLDNSIRLWDVHAGRCLRTFFGHLEGIWGLAADSLRVVSAGNDGMVKIWDPRTGHCEDTYAHHQGPVTCIGLSDRRFCSGSEDHEINLYSF